MLDSEAADIQKQSPKSLNRDMIVNTHNKNTFVVPQVAKHSQNVVVKPLKINRNPSLDSNVSLLVLEVPLDRSMVPQGARVDATSIPSN